MRIQSIDVRITVTKALNNAHVMLQRGEDNELYLAFVNALQINSIGSYDYPIRAIVVEL